MTKTKTVINDQSEYMTVKEFADSTNRTPKTVRRLIANGTISDVIRTTKELLIHKNELQLFFRPYHLEA